MVEDLLTSINRLTACNIHTLAILTRNAKKMKMVQNLRECHFVLHQNHRDKIFKLARLVAIRAPHFVIAALQI